MAIILMPLLSSPRSTNCFMKAAPAPVGTKTNRASGFSSTARCRKGAKSGLASGTFSLAFTVPPAASKVLENQSSASPPGP